MTYRLFYKLKFLLVALLFSFSFNIHALDFDKRFSFNTSSFFQADYLFWHGDKHDELMYGGYLRNLDFCVTGMFLNENLNYFLRFNIDNYFLNDTLSEAYFLFSYDKFSIKIGQINLPFGLEQHSNLTDRTFLETSLLNGMGEGKFFGLSLNFVTNNFCFFSSFVIPDIEYYFKSENSLKYILFCRSFLNFYKYDDFIFHIGVDYKRIKEDKKNLSTFSSIAYRDNPSFKSRSSFLNAYNGVILNSDLIDIELAFMLKSLFFQTELSFVDVAWRDFDKEVYSAFYFQFSYLFNDIFRTYNNYVGAFSYPKIKSFYGVFEILFKYCIVDMINYGSLLMGYCQTDGRKESLLFGLNWLVSEKLKVQLNCVVDEFMYSKVPGFQITGMGFRIQLLF